MKKMTALLSASLLSLTLLPFGASAQMDFSDLPAEHWAYANVQTLVGEGTISGYQDGTFRPGGTVTRAEFVKMIGKGPTRYASDFTDVAPNHWAYDYIMYSGLVSDNTAAFLPDQPIKRIEVINLLWKRAGSPSGFSAPSIITDQSARNKDALAWAYTCGIANGDDGISLRVDDTMSRAEGAALIVRARENTSAGTSKSFVDAVSETVLKQAFDSLDLFDDNTYVPDKAVTYGELARATVRIAGSEHDPSYYTLPSSIPFEHKYARDLDVLGRNVIGTDKVTAEIIDRQVTVADVVASLTFGALHRSATPYAVDVPTEEWKGKMSAAQNNLLTFALKKGIQLDTSADYEHMLRLATLKDIAAAAVQIDRIIGMQTDYSTDAGTYGTGKINHSLDLSGRYYENYQLVLKDVPSAVYNTAFTAYGDSAKAPKSAYRFAQAYSTLFSSSLTMYKNYVKSATGLDCTMVYFPSLTANNGNGYTMRVKITVNSLGSANALSDCFKCGAKAAEQSFVLEAGKTFYADIASGGNFAASMNAEDMFIDQIICEG